MKRQLLLIFMAIVLVEIGYAQNRPRYEQLKPIEVTYLRSTIDPSAQTPVAATSGMLPIADGSYNVQWKLLSGLPSTAGVLPSANGGTGVNNGTSTITLGGNLITSGANSLTFTTTGTTNITLPTSGTLMTSSNSFANPSANIGLAANNGSATTAMRSDATPALSVAIVPTWTGVHTFSAAPVLSTATASQALFTNASKGVVSNPITGTGNVVMSTSPTFTNQVTLGTGTGATAGTIVLHDADNVNSYATTIKANAAIANPGYTLTLPAAAPAQNGQVLSGTTGGALSWVNAATGTVTSVGGTGTVSGLTLSGTVTLSGNLTLGGTLAVAASDFASQTAKTFLAAPNAANGVPTFRAIVASDIPTLNQNTTGTAASITGTYSGTITPEQVTTGLGFTPYNATNPSSYIPLTALSSTATGLTYTNTTGVFSLTSGYSIPTTTDQTNWNKYNQWDGGSTGLTANTGRTSLGATTVGGNLFTLANPSAVRFLRVNADNSVSALDAAGFRTAIGVGTSYTAGNGLTLDGSTFKLGGTLSEATTVTMPSTYSLIFDAVSGSGNFQIKKGSGAFVVYSNSGNEKFQIDADGTAFFTNNLDVYGKLKTKAVDGTSAGLNIPHGTAPSSPANGDVWTTSAGLYARIDGITEKFAPVTWAASTYMPLAGGTMTGKLNTVASAVGGAGLTLPHGAAPTSPANGDIWTTTGGLFARISGATVNVGSPYTFSNGLTHSTGTVKLGGTLTGSTTIDLGTQQLTFNSASSSQPIAFEIGTNSNFKIFYGGTNNAFTLDGSTGDGLFHKSLTIDEGLRVGGTGIDISAGGLDVIGNSVFTNDLTVNGNFYNPSDKRLKRDVETLSGVMDRINQIRGVHFEFINPNKYATGQQIGVIAQELQQVYPELVATGDDGFLKVNYTQLTAVLLQGMKEQQQQINELKERVNQQGQRLDAQQKQIDEIINSLKK